MRLKSRIRSTYLMYYNKHVFKKSNINWESSLVIDGKVELVCGEGARISFGKDVRINSGRRANPSGGGTTKTMFTVGENACLQIGDRTGISNSTIVVRESVILGNDVNIGVNCVIYDNDMHSVEYRDRVERGNVGAKAAPVVISDGAWICGHCIILKGVHIGEKSVVAAGSVVTKNIPSNELWGGNPAKFIKKINDAT